MLSITTHGAYNRDFVTLEVPQKDDAQSVNARQSIFVNCTTDDQRWLERPPSDTAPTRQWKESNFAPSKYYLDRERRIPDCPRPGENHTPVGAMDRIHDELVRLGGNATNFEICRVLKWGQMPMMGLGGFLSFVRKRKDLFKVVNNRIRFAQDDTDYGSLADDDDDVISPQPQVSAGSQSSSSAAEIPPRPPYEPPRPKTPPSLKGEELKLAMDETVHVTGSQSSGSSADAPIGGRLPPAPHKAAPSDAQARLADIEAAKQHIARARSRSKVMKSIP